VGEIELSLTLLGEINQHPAFEIRPIKPYRVLCKGRDLPWLNIYSADLGHEFIIHAEWRIIERGTNPFSYNASLWRHGYTASCKIRHASPALTEAPSALALLRGKIRQSAEKVLGEGERSGIFLSMLFGFRDMLSRGTEDAFKQSSLAHLLVFSGYQVTLMFAMWNWCFVALSRKFARLVYQPYLYLSLRVSLQSIAKFISFALCAALVLVIGLEDSSFRALLALFLTFLANLTDRSSSLFGSIIGASLITTLIWPLSLCEPGLQLTYSALFGIWLGMPRDKFEAKFSSYLYSCFTVWLCTSLITQLWFDQFSLLGAAFNAIFGPFFTLLSCNIGALAFVAHIMGLDSNGYALLLVGQALEYGKVAVIFLAQTFMPGINLNTPFKLIVECTFLFSITLLFARKISNQARQAGIVIDSKP